MLTQLYCTVFIFKWYDGKGFQFHVFRLKPGEKWNIDISRVNSSTQGTAISKKCDTPESIICRQCFALDGQENIHTSEILDVPSSQYYSSFATLTDAPSVKALLENVPITGINFDKVQFEHAFISNFPKKQLVAFLHGNGITDSLAIQFVGKKTWLFFPPEVFRGSEMINAMSGVGTIFPTQSPKKPYDVYRYNSQPGDILFFGENWAHAVYTHAGPNIMMNFRLLTLGNFLRQPVQWLHTLLLTRLYKVPQQKELGRKHLTPYNKIYLEYFRKVSKVCDVEKGAAEWDKQMVQLIKGEI